MSNTYVETFPNHYVGAGVSITLRVRERDKDSILLSQLKWSIEELVDKFNVDYQNFHKK